MSIRIGTSWRSGPGRRTWVSAPIWVLPFLALLWLAALLVAAVVWLVVAAIRLTAWIIRLAIWAGQSLVQAVREERADKAVRQ